MTPNHYDVLGVARDATADDIKAAFRRLAYLHPDQHPGDPTAARRFAVVSAAYTCLSDDEKRARYDAAPQGAGHVTEAVDLVTEVIAGAREIDPARAGLRVLDKVASTEGRQELRGFWQGLRRLLT